MNDDELNKLDKHSFMILHMKLRTSHRRDVSIPLAFGVFYAAPHILAAKPLERLKTLLSVIKICYFFEES